MKAPLVFKSIYDWQLRHYMHTNSQNILSDTRYVVLQWKHLKATNLSLVSIDLLESTVACTIHHIYHLLYVIDHWREYGGCTLSEICDLLSGKTKPLYRETILNSLLHNGNQTLHDEIVLNISALVNHLLSLNMLGPSTLNEKQRYKINGIGDERNNKKYDEIMNKIKELYILPRKCRREHLETIICYAYLCHKNGISISDFKSNGNCDQICRDIAENAHVWFDYCVKRGFLCVIEG